MTSEGARGAAYNAICWCCLQCQQGLVRCLILREQACKENHWLSCFIGDRVPYLYPLRKDIAVFVPLESFVTAQFQL